MHGLASLAHRRATCSPTNATGCAAPAHAPLAPTQPSWLAAFEPFAHQAQMMLLLPQHLQYVREAVKAVQTGSHLGIHLSGPNGVGKTAILQLLHLILTALGIPSVYLPFCEALVNAAAQNVATPSSWKHSGSRTRTSSSATPPCAACLRRRCWA